MGLPNKKSLRDAMPSQGKAKEIMHDGKVRGKPITKPQRGLMAIIMTGGTPSRSDKKVKK